MNQRKIIINPSPTEENLKNLLKSASGDIFRWAYLGENTFTYLSLQKKMSEVSDEILIGESLQETAHLFSDDYIDYVGDLSLENDSLSWWSNNFSERSPYNSKVFLHACYLEICMQLIESRHKNLIIFVEDEDVRQSLKTNLNQNSEVEFYEKKSKLDRITENGRYLINYIYSKSFFIARTCLKIFYSRYVYKINKEVLINCNGEITLVITWMDQRSFKKNKYTDPYLGLLPDKLYQKKEPFVIIPIILLDLSRYKQLLTKIVKSDKSFLVPAGVLTFFDPFLVVIYEIKTFPKRKKYPLFNNRDLSHLIRNDYRKNVINDRTVSNLLHDRMINNLRKQNIQVKSAIFPFENNIRDKILSYSLKKNYPSVRIIGYQHSTVSDLDIGHFISKKEQSIIPIPDRIVVNGRQTKKLLLAQGYEEQKIVLGGAFRYSYLQNSFNNKPAENREKAENPHILVTTSIDLYDSLELIWKVIRTFENEEKYQVQIKCHPYLPFSKIKENFKDLYLPDHITIVDKPMDELLNNVDLLIYTTSTTCIEALASGVPVLHISSNLRLDLDILKQMPDARYYAQSIEGIKKKTDEILSLTCNELIEKRKRWKQVTSEIFEPVTEKSYDVFLSDDS